MHRNAIHHFAAFLAGSTKPTVSMYDKGSGITYSSKSWIFSSFSFNVARSLKKKTGFMTHQMKGNFDREIIILTRVGVHIS
jgi:hypothetical protein